MSSLKFYKNKRSRNIYQVVESQGLLTILICGIKNPTPNEIRNRYNFNVFVELEPYRGEEIE